MSEAGACSVHHAVHAGLPGVQHVGDVRHVAAGLLGLGRRALDRGDGVGQFPTSGGRGPAGRAGCADEVFWRLSFPVAVHL